MKQEEFDIMEWSRKTINSIMKQRNEHNSRWLYHINVICNPNPLDYDGMDEVVTEIIRKDQSDKANRTTSVFFTTKSNYHFNISEAVAEVNNFVITKMADAKPLDARW